MEFPGYPLCHRTTPWTSGSFLGPHSQSTTISPRQSRFPSRNLANTVLLRGVGNENLSITNPRATTDYGFPWISMNFHWFLWISMYFHGFPWISMDVPWTFHGLSMRFPWTFHGLSMDFQWTFDGLSMDVPCTSMDIHVKDLSKIHRAPI